MANPQQPELARSRKVPALEPDASETVLSASGMPPLDPAEGPVPEGNLPGHHPAVEQDKPVEAFVARAKELAAEARAEAEEAELEAVEHEIRDAEVGPLGETEAAPPRFGDGPSAPASPTPATAPLAEAAGISSPLAQRVSGVATMPLRVAGRALERLRDRL